MLWWQRLVVSKDGTVGEGWICPPKRIFNAVKLFWGICYYTAQNYEWPHGGDPCCPAGTPTLNNSMDEKHTNLYCVWTHCVFGSAYHRSLCYLNTGSIFRQRWIETYSGNTLGVNWNPKWWLDWGGIKELRFPQWGTITRQSGWPLSKSLQAINAGEGVEKREPSYTVGGNAN